MGFAGERYWFAVNDRFGLWIPLAAAWAILAAFAGSGLSMGFDADDMMNLFGAWSQPWSQLLTACAAWWSPGYRPLGGLWYRTLFAAAGFDPLPFHAVQFLLLAANLGLTAWLALELTGSRTAAGLAALTLSFNAGLRDLYISTGTIYDVLCYAAYASSVALYVRSRRNGNRPSWPRIAAVLALMVLALDAKEMAVTIPVALLLYEVLYHGRNADWRASAAAFAMLAPYVAGKLSAASQFAGNEAYAMKVEPAVYARAVEHYVYQVLNLPPGSVSVWMAALLAGVALAAGSRAVRFGTILSAAAILPVAFISLRSAFAVYVALLGVAVAIGAALSAIRLPWWIPAAILAFAVWWQQRVPLKEYESQVVIREMADEWGRMLPEVRAGSSVLVLNDPFLPDEWTPLFVARLYYRIPDLPFNRIRLGAENKPEDYTHIVDYVDGRYVLRKRDRQTIDP